MERQPGLRERKKAETSRRIWRVAMSLFTERGFDAVSTAEIAAAADVSKMTLFNYFRTKEELLSFSVEHFGQRVAERFAEAPKNRKPLAALENAILSVMQEEMDDTRQPKEMLGLMFEEPNLRGRFLCALSRWVGGLAGYVLMLVAVAAGSLRLDRQLGPVARGMRDYQS